MLGSRKRNGLKIAFLNIVSLRKYKDELGVILHDNDIDVIGLSETRLDENVQDCELAIDGYKIVRNDRNANGGGVAIYVKDSLPEPAYKSNLSMGHRETHKSSNFTFISQWCCRILVT